MIKIKIIALGKLKEKYLVDAFCEYRKRLGAYCDFSLEEINPVQLSENPSHDEIESALKKEAQMIMKKIPEKYRVVALCVEGKEQSSEDFAKTVEICKNEGKNICFIIGSSYGLSCEIKQKADQRMSVSKMTFPHQLFRVLLAEQIYRAFKICEGSKYHK